MQGKSFIVTFVVVVSTCHVCASGVPVWTNRYNGPGNGPDLATAIGVNASGDVIAAGFSWTGNSYDYATVAYSGDGVPLWTNRYKGPANDNLAVAMAVAGNGNVFVTGSSAQSNVSPYNDDFATVAYSAGGVPLWTNRFNGAGNDDDAANAIAVDLNGNVFVAGRSFGLGTGNDFATLKYSNLGVPLWTNRYNGPGNSDDTAVAMVVDGSGNLIVTGWSRGIESSLDYATIKYSSTGTPLWTNRYTGGGQDQPIAVAVDRNGYVFVLGFSDNGGSFDHVTVAYSADGASLWTNRFNGSANSDDGDLTVDSGGNVFVTGSFWDGSKQDFVTIKYSNAGVSLWTNVYNDPVSGGGQASAVATDMSGNVIVTGFSAGNGTSHDYTTLAYSNTGVPLWTNRFSGPGFGDDRANAMALDRSGNVFVTGNAANGTSSNYDYGTIKYSSSALPIYLESQTLNHQLVLSWTNAAFSLQSAPAINHNFTNLPEATSPFTNSLDAPERYFRLILK